MGTRTGRRSLALAAVVAALAGCGGDSAPHLARADAQPLMALAHRIAHENACAQGRDIRRLRASAAALVHARKAPSMLAARLESGVNALSAQAPPCLPTVPQQAPAEQPAPAVVEQAPPPGHAGKDEKHGHGHHGHGHGGGEGD